MQISEGLLEEIEADEDLFVKFFSSYSEMVLSEARLFPRLSFTRVVDAHGSWRHDLKRVGEYEPAIANGLDHFKRAGHLSFWLRRMSPIIELVDVTTNLGDAEGLPLSADESAFRLVLEAYSNEYIAFDIGLQFCKFYEISLGSSRAINLILSRDYLVTMSNFMKFKTVSPHAMFLIYKSLFQ